MIVPPEPTAEQVVQAVEAMYLTEGQRDVQSVAAFMGLDVAEQHQREQVEHSMLAAEMLEFASLKSLRSRRYTFSVLVPLMVKGRNEDKRVIFGTHLIRYEPFSFFVDRLRTGISPQEAARQTCAVYDFARNPSAAWRAFESWGTYTGLLTRAAGSGQYVAAESGATPVLLRESLGLLSAQDQDAHQFLLDEIGRDAYDFLGGNVRDAVAATIVALANGNEPDIVVTQAGRAYEDFLRFVGRNRVSLRGASSINQIGDMLRARGVIARKHLGAVRLVGHSRNAADHGGDPDEGNRRWHITRSGASLTILAMLSSIRSIALYRSRDALEL